MLISQNVKLVFSLTDNKTRKYSIYINFYTYVVHMCECECKLPNPADYNTTHN